MTSRGALLFWILFIPLFFLNQGLRIHDRGLGDDSREYLAAAYHIAHGQGFSIAQNPDTAEPLDAYRAPAYPAFLSLFILADPGLRHDRFDWLFASPVPMDQAHAPAGIVAVKWVQSGLLLLAALMAMSLARALTGSKGWGYAALILVSLHPFLTKFAHRFYTEMLAAFLVTLFAWLLHRCLTRRKWTDFILAGLCLGALTLTKAQWLYVGPFCLAWVAFMAWRRPEARGRLLAGGLVLALCAAALITPWKMRNQQLFGRALLTEGGGVALDFRSRYATMSAKETLASFLYWSHASFAEDLLDAWFEPEDWAGLDREEGYYRQAMQRHHDLTVEHGALEADRLQFKEAADRILSHPGRYLMTLPALTYRGMVDGNISLFNLAFYVLFFVGLAALVRRRDWEGVGALWPFLGLFLFNSLVTHNLDRFNGTGTALLLVGAMLGVQAWRNQRASRISR